MTLTDDGGPWTAMLAPDYRLQDGGDGWELQYRCQFSVPCARRWHVIAVRSTAVECLQAFDRLICDGTVEYEQ